MHLKKKTYCKFTHYVFGFCVCRWFIDLIMERFLEFIYLECMLQTLFMKHQMLLLLEHVSRFEFIYHLSSLFIYHLSLFITLEWNDAGYQICCSCPSNLVWSDRWTIQISQGNQLSILGPRNVLNNIRETIGSLTLVPVHVKHSTTCYVMSYVTNLMFVHVQIAGKRESLITSSSTHILTRFKMV